MSDDIVGQTPTVFSSKERAALVAKALSEAARRARFSTKRRRSNTSGGLRARRGERIFRLVKNGGFVAVVAIPLLVYGTYIFLIASPQYSAEARFTVIGGIPIGLDSTDAFGGLQASMIMQDTQIILNYLESRAAVEALDKRIGLKALYENKTIDSFSRLSPDLPIEKVVRYWKKQLETKVTLPAGIVTFSARAFSPEDSVKITSGALDASEELVNRLNDKMFKDSTAVAENARKTSEAHLAVTRAALERARNEEGVLSAEGSAESFTKLMDTIKGQMLLLQQNYDSQRRFVSADAPQLRNLQSKIDAAKEQIAKLEARMTTVSSPNAETATYAPEPGEPKVLSMSMTRLEYAKLENEIAEKIYAASLAAVEQARIQSEIKLMYVNRFVEPVLPEESKFPRRGLNFATFAVMSLALWGAIVGITRLALNKLL